MIKVDGSLVIQIVNFAILIWALNAVLYKPVSRMLQMRREKIEGLEDKIAISNSHVSEKACIFAEGIKEARKKGIREKENLLKEALDEEKRITERINKKASQDLAELREKISKDAEGVRETLQQEIDEFADAISKKILGRAV